VQSTPSPQDFLFWVVAAVLLGLMYLIVRYALTIGGDDDERDARSAPDDGDSG
jgi:hypothetical protein